MIKNKYFGTDGIRGKVGDFPITPDFVLKLGWAVGKVLLRSKYHSRKVIIGKDTRISGYMLESALEAGLSSAGLSATFTGPMPTPAIAYLTRTFRADAGIVISASHNLFYDNGIKFFSIEGTKITNEIEQAIEKEINKPLVCVESIKLGKASRIIDAAGRYIEFCKSTFPNNLNLKKLKIVVDCANGTTYHIAPKILSELGAEVISIGCQPNGININEKCGTTDIRQLQHYVLKSKANLGIAYDGDGDRVIMVDHIGNKIDGDQILYIIAREKFKQGKLIGGVVGTIMSNTGLELALKNLGIPFIRTKVGDRYVMSMMQDKNWYIGAENSGHIILFDKTTTGDGIIASLQVLAAVVHNNMHLNDLCNNIHLLPQVLININLINKSDPLKTLEVKKISDYANNKLSGYGRIVLRKSETEPLVRIMVEGKDTQIITQLAYKIANVVKSVINN